MLFLVTVASQAPEPLDLLRDGDYLREEYVESVCRTLSPAQSHLEDYPELLVIKNRDGHVYLMQATFHEGSDDLLVQPDGGLYDESEGATADLRIRVDGRDRVTLSVPGDRDRGFAYVGDSPRWLTEKLLTGEYRDAQGRVCRIEKDGTTDCTGEVLTFTVVADHTFVSYDSMMSGEQEYGLVLSETEVLIYDLLGEFPEQQFAREPRWRLARLSPPLCAE